MRSMPWSNTLPHLDEAPVQRASFPSTVSSTMKVKPDSDAPANNGRARTDRRRAGRATAPIAVMKLGDEAGSRRPAGQIEGRLAPQIERQRVGHALVGGIISGALDRLGIGGIERKHERPLALAQRGVVELSSLGGERVVAVDDRCRSRAPATTRLRILPGRDMRHHRLAAERQHRRAGGRASP